MGVKETFCKKNPSDLHCLAGADVDVKDVEDKDSKPGGSTGTGGARSATVDVREHEGEQSKPDGPTGTVRDSTSHEEKPISTPHSNDPASWCKDDPHAEGCTPDPVELDVSVPHEHTESSMRPVVGGGGGNSGDKEDLRDDSTGSKAAEGRGGAPNGLKHSADGWKKLVEYGNIAELATILPAVAQEGSDEVNDKAAKQVNHDSKHMNVGLTHRSPPDSPSAVNSSTGKTDNAVKTGSVVGSEKPDDTSAGEAPAAAAAAAAEGRKGEEEDVVNTEQTKPARVNKS